ncbi:MAG: HAD family hydrolase [Candidatus Adiutrix sp.]|jgi:HAD superfamily hydrolase (TIGR01509 family)|nr:HAD family hydrolase [Candidatus Adiutrix sp.]
MTTTFIFDFDMTLVDSIFAVTRGLNRIARHFNLPPVTESETRRVMSLETKDFWTTLWGRYEAAWSEYFVAEVAGREANYLEIVPGAEAMLAELNAKGAALALATNRGNAWAALSSTGLSRYFDAAVGANDVARGKPAPDMLYLAMDRLKTDPGQAIYIGDAVYDMQAARAAGIKGLGLLQAGASAEELTAAGAWKIRATLIEARDLLELS